MKGEATKKFEELTKKLDRMKRRVNDLMTEIQHRCAENVEIEKIERLLNGKQQAKKENPKWQLTPFDGDIMQFGELWDQFQASVHSRTYLNDIEKFICLRSNLKGPALDMISGFSITATNYPEMTESSPTGLRKLYDKLMLHFRALRAMGKDPTNEFVRKQIDIEEKVTFTKGTKSTGVEKCPTTFHENRAKERPEFLASDVDERWRIAKRLLVCHSCLKKGHRKIECGVSEKTATGETTIHNLLNRKDVGDKKIDEKPEENITKVCLKMSVDKKHGSPSYSNGSLQIARAVICAENGIKRTVNCILDSGAQRSFVRREVVESLELNVRKNTSPFPASTSGMNTAN
ncbi:hypothetical protein T06_11915 [Trichinella sp. T6]|nr:hypothetical protein T06_11915 [Trichinella sp. T6]